MKIQTAGALIGIVLAGGPLRAQSSATPSFEVATIRAASFPTPETIRSRQARLGSRIDGSRVDFGFVSMADLLQYAFRVKSFQIVMPDWVRQSRWNVQATLPEGASSAQVPEMVQSLLVERFQLKTHHEKREQPVYEIVAGKGGPKLEPAAPGSETTSVENSTGPGIIGAPGLFPGPGFGGPPPGAEARGGAGRGGPGMVLSDTGGSGQTRISPGANCSLHIEFDSLTMQTLADTLTPMLDRAVVDGTGLKGSYKLTLELPMEVMFAMMQNMARSSGMPGPGGRGPGGGGPGGGGPGGGGPAGGPPGGPRGGLAGCIDPASALAAGESDTSNTAIFQALQKVGLKLQARKAPFDTVVIDSIEKSPSEN